MLPPAIQTVLHTLHRHGVQCLLMGGQACIYYGGAEFSRDVDFAALADEPNLSRLATAMAELQAEVIAVPPFAAHWLNKGQAVHFRCQAEGVQGLRVDVMSRMRGVAEFAELWERRTPLPGGGAVLSLPDLVLAKKTQSDKDWPMIRRLMEADYLARRDGPGEADAAFWLQELRTPELLLEAVTLFPGAAVRTTRPATLLASQAASPEAITAALREEEDAERAADRLYWQPLRKQLEELRRQRLT